MKKILLLLFFFFTLLKSGNAQPVGGIANGGTVYCSSSILGTFIGAVGYTGTILQWQDSITGSAWANIPGSSFTPYNPPNPTQSTCYRVEITMVGWPNVFSTKTCIIINPATVPGTLSGTSTHCVPPAGAGQIALTAYTGNVLHWKSSTDGGTTWTNIANINDTLTYTGLSVATLYQAVLQSGPAVVPAGGTTCKVDSTLPFSITTIPVSFAGNVVLNGTAPICYLYNSGSVSSSGTTGSITSWLSSTDGGTTWTNISNSTTVQNFSSLLQPTSYATIVQNGICPPDTSLPLLVTMFPMPAAVNAGIDTVVMPGQSITLTGSGTGTPLWSPITDLSNPATYTPIATPTLTTTYVLTVTDANGCPNTDSVVIKLKLPDFKGVVSNYFSPNGDGINDTWYIEDIGLFKTNEVTVYNIYGNEVFAKKGYTGDWKGTYNGADLPDGTYYYVLKFSDAETIRKGTIEIMRKK